MVVAIMLVISALAFSGCGCGEKKSEVTTDAKGNPITSAQTTVQQTDKNGKVIKKDKKADVNEKAKAKAKDQKNKKLKKKDQLKNYSDGDGDDVNDLINGSKKSKKSSSKKSSSKKNSKKNSSKKGNLDVGENTEEGWGPLEDGN